MALLRIQNVVVVIVLVPTLLCPWPTLATTKASGRPRPTKPPVPGPIGDLVKLRSIDEIPVLSHAPAGLHVLVVTRHGMYTPVSPSTLDGDKNKEFLGDPPPRLTRKGEDLMDLVGKLLVRRYADHFNNIFLDGGEKAETRVRVTASDIDIAKRSAEKIFTGMKEQYPELDGLELILSQYNIERTQYFNPLLLSKQIKNSCKAFDTLAKNLKDPKTIKMTVPPFKGEFAEDVFQQYDRLQLERLEEQDLPDWTKKENGRETLRQMNNAAIIRMENLIGDNIAFWKYFVSYFLDNIFLEFVIHDRADQTLSRVSRFHLHVVDDHLMTALVWWLRLDGEIDVAFGDPVAEYYPQAGDSLVLEINDQKMVTASYIRLVGESESQVGFKTLSLSKKTEDFTITFNSYEGKKTYPLSNYGPDDDGVSAHFFYNHIITGIHWNEYCSKKKRRQ